MGGSGAGGSAGWDVVLVSSVHSLLTVQAIEKGRVRRKCGVFIKHLEAKDNGVWELIVHRNPRGRRTFRPITKRMDLSP